MTILITGGTGLVGSRLLRRLVDAGVECRAIVRPGKNLPQGVTPIEGDVLNPETLAAAVEGVSAVIHLAAVLRTPHPDQIRQVNVEGTQNLIDATKAHAPGARVILASTGLVYNADLPRPAREGDPADPAMPYPASKIVAERALRESGLTWSILRLPFVYGDGDGHLASIPELARRFDLHPAHTYSVAHHRDVAGIVRLALSGVTDGRIVNVTDDADATVWEMAALAGDPVEASAGPLERPWSGRMDGSLARTLGFRPTVPTIRMAADEGIL